MGKKRFIDCGLTSRFELSMANKKQLQLSDKPKSLTPELVIKMLKEKGHAISISEAEKVLKFMRNMANIAVNTYLNSNTPNVDQNK